MKNGDEISVYQRDTDDEGNEVWLRWFDGVYLTTENVGNGPEMRVKNIQTGEHLRLRESADDIKIERHNESVC